MGFYLNFDWSLCIYINFRCSRSFKNLILIQIFLVWFRFSILNFYLIRSIVYIIAQILFLVGIHFDLLFVKINNVQFQFYFLLHIYESMSFYILLLLGESRSQIQTIWSLIVTLACHSFQFYLA